jgi:hypothetical protein
MTAEPAPPATAFSSMVISAACVPGETNCQFFVSGFTKRMFTTVASSRSAMISAGFTIAPNARISRPLLPSAAHLRLAHRQRRHLRHRRDARAPGRAG